ncbi:hypothetical protein EG68_06482 [Paragonimus skrjabini miyazakii]|uniref:Uncharacterized protein n=1 Tax=Paragonimus skrjabini miyazakii TaxID=59628 RepID=A0A8S9YPZ0_9TREM|nr:hypothetical protein EG68_06482 [Paragonimus skrjabini miyazakii]
MLQQCEVFNVLRRGFKRSLDLHTKYRVLCFLRYVPGREEFVSASVCCPRNAIHSDKLLLSLSVLYE